MHEFSESVPLFKGIIKAHLAQKTAKGRTSNPHGAKFKDYMGRGIKMCAGFRDPWTFLAIMGPCDPDKSLDRRNNDGHYSCGQCPECLANNWPMNCRWATGSEQALNRRKRCMLTLNGSTRHATEWSSLTGISNKRIHRRKQMGWNDERILTERVRKHPVTAKLSEPDVLTIRERYKSTNGKYGTIAALARHYKVGRDTIRAVIDRSMWKTV